jgi:hypothetical protein
LTSRAASSAVLPTAVSTTTVGLAPLLALVETEVLAGGPSMDGAPDIAPCNSPMELLSPTESTALTLV